MQVQVTGIAWYTRQTYARCLEIMEDRDVLPATYDQWRKKADAGVKHFEGRGIRVIRAEIDPEQFVAWCAARQMKIDAKARMDFAAEMAARAVQQNR